MCLFPDTHFKGYSFLPFTLKGGGDLIIISIFRFPALESYDIANGDDIPLTFKTQILLK